MKNINTNNIFGERLKKIRKEKGYTKQDALALKTNYSKQSISNFETGRQRIDFNAAKRLGDALNIDPNYFLDENLKLPGELIEEGRKEDYRLTNVIINLAILNGYTVEFNNNIFSKQAEDIITAVKKYITLSRGNEKIELSLTDCNKLGNSMAEIFQSNLRFMRP